MPRQEILTPLSPAPPEQMFWKIGASNQKPASYWPVVRIQALVPPKSSPRMAPLSHPALIFSGPYSNFFGNGGFPIGIYEDSYEVQAVEADHIQFGADVDYAMLVKLYGKEPDSETRYSPAKCIAAEPHVIQGNPDPSKISTSFAERQNLTMRMSIRRFTRLTNGFSKKVENLEHAVALHFMFYNFARPHKTLANPYPRTPAMAAGIENHIWSIEEIVKLL